MENELKIVTKAKMEDQDDTTNMNTKDNDDVFDETKDIIIKTEEAEDLSKQKDISEDDESDEIEAKVTVTPKTLKGRKYKTQLQQIMSAPVSSAAGRRRRIKSKMLADFYLPSIKSGVYNKSSRQEMSETNSSDEETDVATDNDTNSEQKLTNNTSNLTQPQITTQAISPAPAPVVVSAPVPVLTPNSVQTPAPIKRYGRPPNSEKLLRQQQKQQQQQQQQQLNVTTPKPRLGRPPTVNAAKINAANSAGVNKPTGQRGRPRTVTIEHVAKRRGRKPKRCNIHQRVGKKSSNNDLDYDGNNDNKGSEEQDGRKKNKVKPHRRHHEDDAKLTRVARAAKAARQAKAAKAASLRQQQLARTQHHLAKKQVASSTPIASTSDNIVDAHNATISTARQRQVIAQAKKMQALAKKAQAQARRMAKERLAQGQVQSHVQVQDSQMQNQRLISTSNPIQGQNSTMINANGHLVRNVKQYKYVQQQQQQLKQQQHHHQQQRQIDLDVDNYNNQMLLQSKVQYASGQGQSSNCNKISSSNNSIVVGPGGQYVRAPTSTVRGIVHAHTLNSNQSLQSNSASPNMSSSNYVAINTNVHKLSANSSGAPVTARNVQMQNLHIVKNLTNAKTIVNTGANKVDVDRNSLLSKMPSNINYVKKTYQSVVSGNRTNLLKSSIVVLDETSLNNSGAIVGANQALNLNKFAQQNQSATTTLQPTDLSSTSLSVNTHAASASPIGHVTIEQNNINDSNKQTTTSINPNLQSQTNNGNGNDNKCLTLNGGNDSTDMNENTNNKKRQLEQDIGEQRQQQICDEEAKRKKLSPMQNWTPEQVAEFISSKGFLSEAELFKEQDVDGLSLLLMQRIDFLTCLPMKLGPALRIYDHVRKLKEAEISQVHQRKTHEQDTRHT